MSVVELVEQLELICEDHPEAATLDVRVNDLDVFVVHLDSDSVRIELHRPWALT